MNLIRSAFARLRVTLLPSKFKPPFYSVTELKEQGQPRKRVQIYCDGSSLGNGQVGSRAAAVVGHEAGNAPQDQRQDPEEGDAARHRCHRSGERSTQLRPLHVHSVPV